MNYFIITEFSVIDFVLLIINIIVLINSNVTILLWSYV